MERALRIDVGTLAAPKQLPDGRMRADAHLTRAGVFEYRNPDGSIRRELRDPKQVFDAASLESLEAVPVTDNHPPAMVTAENAATYTRGQVGDTVRRDGDHIAAKITINDKALIDKMKAGVREVSCGYTCDIDNTPGIHPDYGRYDAVQTNIVYNHAAVLPRGRAGSAKVRMDGAAVMHIGDDDSARGVERKDSAVMNLEQALAALANTQEKLGAEKARADAADKLATERKVDLDKVTAAKDDLKEKFDTAEKARKDAIDAGPGLVRERVALETAAAPIMGKTFKMDALDDRAIQVAVIKKVTNADVDAKASNDYVKARFDAAIERASTSEQVFRDANNVIQKNRADASVVLDAALTERAKLAAENANLNATFTASLAAAK